MDPMTHRREAAAVAAALLAFTALVLTAVYRIDAATHRGDVADVVLTAALATEG
jgi:hypothetical protein